MRSRASDSIFIFDISCVIGVCLQGAGFILLVVSNISSLNCSHSEKLLILGHEVLTFQRTMYLPHQPKLQHVYTPLTSPQTLNLLQKLLTSHPSLGHHPHHTVKLFAFFGFEKGLFQHISSSYAGFNRAPFH